MFKGKLSRLISWRMLLVIVILTLLQAALAWLVFKRVSLFEDWFFGDVLLMFGALDGAIGGLTMIRNYPYSASNSPVGVPAFGVQATEEERRAQLMEEMKSQRSFAAYLTGTAVLTILLSLAVTYL